MYPKYGYRCRLRSPGLKILSFPNRSERKSHPPITPTQNIRPLLSNTPSENIELRITHPGSIDRGIKMSSLQPPDYSNTPSGFFHVYSHRKFVGFVSDVEDCNRVYLLTHPISRSEIEQLFTNTVTALHGQWCSDIKKGSRLPTIKKNQFLNKALDLMRGPDVERYWEEKDKESEAAREQEMLIGVSRARVAKQTEVVVVKEQT